jgi:hypothetical protein
MHGRAFATIEHPKLDPCFVDGLPHEATQGIDFAYNLTFSNPANGWIATHLTDGI